jgi:hypothetical protein
LPNPSLEENSAPTPVPGAWERRGRSIDDGPRSEPSLVIWLQVGLVFADIRLPRPGRYSIHPLDAAQAFSGTLHVDKGLARWRHDLDTAGRSVGSPDRAMLEQRGSQIVERGEGYVEYWRRCAPVNARQEALERRLPGTANDLSGPAPGLSMVQTRLVRVGAYAVAVWSRPEPGACLFARRRALAANGMRAAPGTGLARRWAVVGSVGEPLGRRAALSVLSALDGDMLVPPGWEAPI